MFGGFRFLLAFLVVLSHLSGSEYFVHFGYYAVRAFFFLSGFVITSALNEIYSFDLLSFWMNRLLRLFPLYYVVCLATLLLVNMKPIEAAEFAPFWDHQSLRDIGANLSLLPLQFKYAQFRLVMPAWSIAVEVTMYAFLSMVFSRRALFCFILFSFGVLYHSYSVLSGDSFADRYFGLQSATLSFSLGALGYFWHRQRRSKLPTWWAWPLLLVWAVNMGVSGLLLQTSYTTGVGYYASILLGGALVLVLADWRPGGFLRNLDCKLGELAYPLFLAHWLVGFVVALTMYTPQTRGYAFTMQTVLFLVPVCLALAAINNALIEPLRTRIRERVPGESTNAQISMSRRFVPERA